MKNPYEKEPVLLSEKQADTLLLKLNEYERTHNPECIEKFITKKMTKACKKAYEEGYKKAEKKLKKETKKEAEKNDGFEF